MSENENKSEKRAQIHAGAGGIVREIECWYCIALLNDAKMNLNDANRNFRARKWNWTSEI